MGTKRWCCIGSERGEHRGEKRTLMQFGEDGTGGANARYRKAKKLTSREQEFKRQGRLYMVDWVA